jgi:hypothetical protein
MQMAASVNSAVSIPEAYASKIARRPHVAGDCFFQAGSDIIKAGTQ